MEPLARAAKWFDTVFGAGKSTGEISLWTLARIIKEAIEDEREACAKIADARQNYCMGVAEHCAAGTFRIAHAERSIGAAHVAEDIRKSKEK